MLFTDLKFIFLFLPLFLTGYFYFSKDNRWPVALIFGFSLLFHSLYSPTATALLLFSIGINYLFIKKIYQNKKVLILSLIFNLGVLFFFKYVGFFADVLNDLFGLQLPRYHPNLPLGISFFTFTQIACLVDSYQEYQKKSYLNYSAFVSYFPHLIAGPIIHYKPMVAQFLNEKTRHLKMDTFISGLMLFSLGLAKKIILADTIAEYINPVFNDIDPTIPLATLDAWMLALGYTFQLYFDFSGYTDMAIGISRMINVDLPKNFNSPFIRTNLIDFWRCWHMSLSTFLKDYLYIPLGGNRRGALRRYGNLLITMLLGGIWHGAGYTFAFWGLYHGIGLCLNHLICRLNFRIPKLLGWLFTFFFVVNGWVIFRSPNLNTAQHLYQAMYSSNKATLILPNSGLALISFMAIGYFVSYFLRPIILTPTTREDVLVPSLRYPKITLFFAGLLFAISLIMTTNDSPFLYFQF